MDRLAKPGFLIVSFLVFIYITSAASVGTAPGTLDLGELERGESYEAYFYVTTRGVESNFVLEPDESRAPRSFFERDSSEDFIFNPEEASQQDKSDWISFDSSEYVVNPNDRNVVQLEDGSSVVYNERIRFQIDVPEDAEPGHHIGAMDLNPDMDRSGVTDSSVLNLGLTQPIFHFEIPGQAVRNMEVVDVRAVRTGDNQARFDFIVQNNGTVTNWVRRSSTILYDDVGEESGEITAGGDYIAPGETKVVSTTWNSDRVEGGDYRVSGEVDYITGQSFLDETVSISDVIQVESDEEDVDGGVPTWLVIMVLVVIGVVMYSFKIDPIYIFALLGVVAITWFIMITGLPTYLIALVILMAGGILYYG